MKIISREFLFFLCFIAFACMHASKQAQSVRKKLKSLQKKTKPFSGKQTICFLFSEKTCFAQKKRLKVVLNLGASL